MKLLKGMFWECCGTEEEEIYFEHKNIPKNTDTLYSLICAHLLYIVSETYQCPLVWKQKFLEALVDQLRMIQLYQ